MSIDLDELERLADAATQGKRVVEEWGALFAEGTALVLPFAESNQLTRDKAFIEAVDPAVIRELIQRLRAAERLQPPPSRHMDGIDAGIAAQTWLEGFIKSIPPHPGLQIERMNFVLESGATPNGSIILLWRWNTLLAQATMVRDSANFTVLTIQEFQR